MRAIVKKDPGPGAEMVYAADDRIGRSDEVLVRPAAVSICGTDYHVYSWDAWSASRVHPPRRMGHEFAGVVVEVGPDVRNLRPGDYVSGESHRVCGRCLQCRTGQAHVCAETLIYGVDVDGCFAEAFAVPEASLWRNPPEMPAAIAAVQDPLGNAVHTTLSGPIAGCTVLVSGCGPIGLMAIAVARACGAATIIASDARTYRLGLARRLGADRCVDVTCEDPLEAVHSIATDGVDVALEMSGAPSAVVGALKAVRRGGRVSLLGIPTTEVSINLAEDVVFKGLTIHGIVGRRLYETWATMSSLLSSGRLDITPVITHEMGFDEFEQGMALMRDGACGKVVLHLR